MARGAAHRRRVDQHRRALRGVKGGGESPPARQAQHEVEDLLAQGSKPKRGAKGVETERRDNSAWLRRVYGRVADILLPVLDLDGDQDARIDRAAQQVERVQSDEYEWYVL